MGYQQRIVTPSITLNINSNTGTRNRSTRASTFAEPTPKAAPTLEQLQARWDAMKEHVQENLTDLRSRMEPLEQQERAFRATLRRLSELED